MNTISKVVIIHKSHNTGKPLASGGPNKVMTSGRPSLLAGIGIQDTKLVFKLWAERR